VVCVVAWWWPVCRDLGDGGAGAVLVDDVLARCPGGDQGLGGEVVDGAGQAAGGVVDQRGGVVAEQRVGAAGEGEVVVSARVLWDHRDFDDERDSRVGDVDELEPRSRQARRGLVTRGMLAELRAFLEEVYGTRERGAGGERQVVDP
jgi:hypothetical protein